MVKACVSVCKTFPKSECNPPRCSYINGNKRKYCRLSHKYKMNKPKCNVTRRLKKSEVGTYYKNRISEAIKSSKLFLNKICPNTGRCLAFGTSTDKLTKYFNGFTKFDYVVSPIKRLGVASANGFIHEINYDKNGYKASSILKSAKTAESDNLVYEYLVGIKYINRKLKLFPCFLETYGLYYYDTPASWTMFKDTAQLNAVDLQHLVLQNNTSYVKACAESKYASCLIQHINKAPTIYELCMNDEEFITNELVFTLFIVYQALSSISATFTHYDLHYNNILLYKPKPLDDHYIEYYYHNNDGTSHSFYSMYIPKIIDYGRSFFDNGNVNSHTIYEKICNTRECDPKCGNDFGLGWLDTVPYLTISSSKKNESHDLRLLSDLKIKISAKKLPGNAFKELQNLFKHLVYGVGLKGADAKYGSTENLTQTNFTKGTYTPIYNVTGAFTALKYIVTDPDVLNENKNTYSTLTKLGDLHVYNNGRPMEYEKIV